MASNRLHSTFFTCIFASDMNKAGSSKLTDEEKETANKPEYREVKDNGAELSSPSSSSSSSSPSASDDEDGKADARVSYIQRFLAQKLHLSQDSDKESDHILETVDFDGIIKHWKSKGFKKIVTMVGAGISTCK